MNNKIINLFKGILEKNKYRSTKRSRDLWVFGEWFGERCCDNSKYFANYIATHYPEICVIWITKSTTDISSLNPTIQVLYMDSKESMEALLKCGVAIISQGFQDLTSSGFNYTDGAVSVHLWHGVPWKRIGHDGSKKKDFLYEIYKKCNDYAFGTNFYASPSDKYDDIAITAHGAKRNQIIHAGYPRNADFYHPDKVKEGKNRIISELKKVALDYDFSTVKIVSYMPTFRNDASHSFSFESLRSNSNFIHYLTDNNIIIIQKAHFVDQTRDGKIQTNETDRIFSLNNISAQDLLCATDLLVTDYSGAFFDYLLLNRPIVHYLYDYDYYRTKDRGLYYKKEDVIAGEEADDEEQLANAIMRNMMNPNLFAERRHMIRNIYMKYDTPNSCEVLYQAILRELKRRNFNESTNS